MHTEVNMNSVIDLPTEILCLILDKLPLSSHFAFACTCKTFAAASQHILQCHQEAHLKFHVVSDQDPATVPLLLDSVFGSNPIPAWHVRSFEVWRDRTSWDEWETYSLHTPMIVGLDGGVSDLDVIGFQSLLGRVGEYIDWLEDFTCGDFDFKREKAITQVERGYDGFLKALLFASLPRLRDLKLVTRSQATGSTLSWMKVLIAASKGAQPEPEPEPEHDDCQPSSEESRRDSCKGAKKAEEFTWEKVGWYAPDAPPCWTESDFNRGWDLAIAKWDEEQAIAGLMSMELDELDPAKSEVHDTEMSICEDGQSIKSANESAAMSDAVASPETGVDFESWPPGFLSLQSVAVGVVSDTWMDDVEYPKSAALVARLLRLPNINSFYLNGLRHEETDQGSENDDDSDVSDDSEWAKDEWKIYDFSSSVQHLFFEGVEWELHEETREWLSSVPEKLLTIGFRFNRSGPDAGELHSVSRIVNDIAEAQGSSLQSLMFYGFDSSSLDSDDCSMVLLGADSVLHDFEDLRQLSLNVHDIATSVYEYTQGQTPKGYNSHDDYYVELFATALPESLECLVLWENADSGLCGSKDALERAVIGMVQSGRYKHLKAIHLEQVERATDGGNDTHMFDRAVEAGRAAGVGVFTQANKCLETTMLFPEPVEWFDLRTGKWPHAPPSSWVFDNYTGRREPLRSCGLLEHANPR